MISYAAGVEGVVPRQLEDFFEGWTSPPSPEQHLEALRGAFRVVLALDGDRVVGFVNAISDGLNLVAKEAPLVNTQNGVLILSENTGAHEELGEFSLSVNPFDVQELADAIYSALTMSSDERARRADGLKAITRFRVVQRFAAHALGR
jgi:trehalose-6-phosphate synthase